MRGKRQVHRKLASKGLVRRADGRLRPADESDIGDMWAHTKRLQLKEAIRKDQKKRERKERRQGGGVEVSLRLPDISWVEIAAWMKRATRPLAWLASRKRVYIIAACLAVIAVWGGSALLGGKKGDSSGAQAGVLGGQDRQEKKPDYPTVLPADKTIEELGGWSRVSPPDKDPVFAYADEIARVGVLVSQQPLPDTLKKDRIHEVAKLAEQFSATEKIMVGGLSAFVGTSSQGPQSVIFARGDLLILAKSAERVPNDLWIDYLSLLQ